MHILGQPNTFLATGKAYYGHRDAPTNNEQSAIPAALWRDSADVETRLFYGNRPGPPLPVARALAFSTVNQCCTVHSYGRARRLTVENGGWRRGRAVNERTWELSAGGGGGGARL